MTIRFASARAGGISALRAWRCHSAPMCAANDNAVDRFDNAGLIAALRHFARHGLAAAEHASTQALHAHRQSDREACRHWLEVCRQLDRRLAERLCSTLGTSAA